MDSNVASQSIRPYIGFTKPTNPFVTHMRATKATFGSFVARLLEEGRTFHLDLVTH
jgi:hypothetical protein